MQLITSRNAVLLIWLCIVGLSAAVNLQLWHNHYYDIGFRAAEGFFRQIEVTRRWSAEHGGLYARTSESTQPNPYLRVEHRDIPNTPAGDLTLINPSYMTRQLSMLAAQTEGIQFRITSLDPLRPRNAPTSREQRYLQGFESMPEAAGEIVVDGGRRSFFYMAPLMTEQSCLQCHADQGYELGDVRGGISVEIPYDSTTRVEAVIIASHAGLFLSGAAAVLLFFRRLTSYVDRTEYDAEHDVLTSLPNRRSILSGLNKEYRRSRRHGTPLTVLMIDIDHFKPINDTHGHAVGDDCLRQVASTLSRLLRRGGDEIGRLGGEEFLALLPDTDNAEAATMAEHLRAAAGALRFRGSDGSSFGVTISIGLASRSEDDSSSDALLERADKALYSAKQSGRNRVCEADHDME